MDDDDRARMDHTEVKLLGITVAKLLSIENLHAAVPTGRRGAFLAARTFLQEVDTELNIFGRLPDKFTIQRIKDLAWLYRREMPKHLAPKLPPHDPIVREMEARGG